MEAAALEVQQFARSGKSLFTGAQASEILGCLGDDIGTKLHLDPALGRSANGYIKENDLHQRDVWGSEVIFVSKV